MKQVMAITIDSEVTHALKDDKLTLCGMRPIKWKALPGSAITCPKCREILEVRKVPALEVPGRMHARVSRPH